MTHNNGDLKKELAASALELGFDLVRVTSPDSIPHAPGYLADFIERGYHGDMGWMADNMDKRGNPHILWPEVRSVILLGMNYGSGRNPLDDLQKTDCGIISVYAGGRDYHDIIKKKLRNLASWLHGTTGEPVKIFVDTAPVMEKPLAQSAGIGWQGKHTNLVSRQFGSWLFLGSIFTSAEIAPDSAEVDHCGSCTRCLDICPTDAFPAPYRLDARKCIAYLTIEHKGHIDSIFREKIGNRVFGCDDCLAVCPWNKYAKTTSEIRFMSREETGNPPIAELLILNDEEFRKRFAGTPVKRTGRDRFIRNVLIATGNSGDRELLPRISELLKDKSPLVRAMAVWACRKLMNSSEFSTLRHKMANYEIDDDVRQEWVETGIGKDR